MQSCTGDCSRCTDKNFCSERNVNTSTAMERCEQRECRPAFMIACGVRISEQMTLVSSSKRVVQHDPWSGSCDQHDCRGSSHFVEERGLARSPVSLRRVDDMKKRLEKVGHQLRSKLWLVRLPRTQWSSTGLFPILHVQDHIGCGEGASRVFKELRAGAVVLSPSVSTR